jgi:hypothetical protein
MIHSESGENTYYIETISLNVSIKGFRITTLRIGKRLIEDVES